MKTAFTFVAVASLSLLMLAQNDRPKSPVTFPKPDFTLHDTGAKQQKSGVVLGPMKTDKQGRTTGSLAIYGGSSLVQVLGLSFSGDGKLLAVGSTPSNVDIWDVETRTKLRARSTPGLT